MKSLIQTLRQGLASLGARHFPCVYRAMIRSNSSAVEDLDVGRNTPSCTCHVHRHLQQGRYLTASLGSKGDTMQLARNVHTEGLGEGS